MIRVATVPYAHPYLDAVLPTEVVRVGPPPPDSDPWAPSPWLDPAYLAAHADEVDVVHLHFGFDGLTPTRCWPGPRRSGAAASRSW